MTAVRFISSEDVTTLAEPADYVAAVRRAYRDRGNGAEAVPRTKLGRDDVPGMLTGYLAVLPEVGGMGGYTYAAGFGSADAWFVTPLFDADSGELLAIVDGASMNPFKTGAAGAVAVDELARADAATVGLVGAGSQARGQLLATATVRDLETVRVFSPTTERREAFAAEFDGLLDAEVVAVDDAGSAVRDADVVITATTAAEPVIDDADVADGAHITAMGQYDPARREIPAATVARSKYVPDLRDRAFQDAGAFLNALEAGAVDEDHVYAELGDVVAGTVPGRESADEVTLFDSGGTGIETVGAAMLLYERAVERDVGTEVEFSPASEAMPGRR